MEASIERIRETINLYEKIIRVLKDNRGEDEICKLSKKKLSGEIGLSYTGTLNKLKFLIKYGLVEVKDRGFVITDRKLLEDTPLGLLPAILLLVFDYPEIFGNFNKQSQMLDVSMEDTQSAWGFYSYFFGSKYPGKSELSVVGKLVENRL
jgi:hypothetical protein